MLVLVGFLLLLVVSLGVSLGMVATQNNRVSSQGYIKGQVGGSTGKILLLLKLKSTLTLYYIGLCMT